MSTRKDDAVNKQDTLAYYEHNGFVYMHKTEEMEHLALKRYDEEGNLIFELSEEEPLHMRLMYFALQKRYGYLEFLRNYIGS